MKCVLLRAYYDLTGFIMKSFICELCVVWEVCAPTFKISRAKLTFCITRDVIIKSKPTLMQDLVKFRLVWDMAVALCMYYVCIPRAR